MTWYKPALLRFKIPKFAELPSDVDHCEEMGTLGILRFILVVKVMMKK
jgi:hypothetical protein